MPKVCRWQFTPLALNDVFFKAFETIQPLARQKHLSLEFQEIQPAMISGDAGLIQRLLTNLISNAVRYTTAGGKIIFALHTESSNVVVAITDTGIGIPEEALPYIFDRFYRVEQSRSHETGGSGLGLAIAQKIVELHGGEISVQSTVGQGTTFRVSLPCIS
jgi:OmpR-family two-component system manganese-sensing sensor histidine kinase